MKKIPTYNKKWLIYILSFFLFFAIVMIISEYFHEKKIRINSLNDELNRYTDLIERYSVQNKMNEAGDFTGLDSFHGLIAKDALRITVIAFNGNVLYDSDVSRVQGMENHLRRPEVQSALEQGTGTNIRVSATTNIKYYYYAKRYNDYIVRVSVIYNITAKKLIQPDRIFLFFVIILFLAASFTIVLLTDKFGKSISTLRDFTLKALANKPIDEKMDFPENELGVIGQEIIDIYRNLHKTKEELLSEKAKLIRHLNIIDEGIAIFSKEKHTITCNNNFIRYVNHISDERIFTPDEFFRVNDFSPLFLFINKYLTNEEENLADLQPSYEITINKNGKYFHVKSIVFQDRSFEVSVNDVTKPAKRKLLKQQMTENIAHELKTPVSSIKGFLETLLSSKADKARMTDYLQRAYTQSCRLSNLINDISLLTKIEEAGSLYQIEKVHMDEVVREITGEIQPQLDDRKITLILKIPDDLVIPGNPALLYSIFRNLFDNAIIHGGNGITITLDRYTEDSNFHYFSFSDTGSGVPEEDLPRLFERFYRVDKGRDRKKGGTGLGLAIVKNAIQFHKGDISVKNRISGGLEFLFTLSKDHKEFYP
jgi:two-component system, OmpR family, phosphate regulon sensor histidine kinase PhoR